MGVATGCGCKEVYRFPHTTYPYSSCICSFLQQHPYFLFILKMFFLLVPVLFCNYILCINAHQLTSKSKFFKADIATYSHGIFSRVRVTSIHPSYRQCRIVNKINNARCGTYRACVECIYFLLLDIPLIRLAGATGKLQYLCARKLGGFICKLVEKCGLKRRKMYIQIHLFAASCG